MLSAARKLQAGVGAILGAAVSGWLFYIFRKDLAIAFPVMIVVLAALWGLLGWYIHHAGKKNASQSIAPSPAAEGTSFEPQQRSPGSQLVLNALAASAASIVAPVVVASGVGPFAFGPSQTFADNVRRRLDESLGFIATYGDLNLSDFETPHVPQPNASDTLSLSEDATEGKAPDELA
jgi:hypothetical protein